MLDAAAGPRRLAGRAAWTPGRSGTPTPTGSATNAARTRLYWTEPRADRRRRPGPVGLQQLRARRRRLDGPLRRLHPALPPVRLPHPQPRRRRRRLADRLRRPAAATTSRSRPNCRSPGRTGRGATRTATRTARTRSAATATIVPARRGAPPGIDMRVGPVAIPNGRFGNRPHCIYRGFCLQGCKVNAKASPLITHIPDALAHGAEIRADCHVSARPGRRPHRPRPPASTYLRAGVEHRQRRPRRSPSPATPSRPRGCCCSRPPAAIPDGLGNDHDQVGRYLMVQGAPQTAGRFDDEIRMYKAPPPEVSSEAVLRNRPDQAVPARLVHPDRQPAADHLGRTRHRPRTLGQRAARVHARLRALGHPRRAVRIPAPARQPGHPGRRDRPPRPARRALRLQPSATTTSS